MQRIYSIALACMFPFTSYSLSCLDQAGHSIDSWSIIKAPQSIDSYLYATTTGDFYAPTTSLNDTTKGALSATMNQLWNTDESISYILYNDEPPLSTGYNFSVGHTKGLLALSTNLNGETLGFYLTHSIPKFPTGPATTSSYSGLPSNAWTYGQSAYCLSLDGATANDLALALQLQVPFIYESKTTDAVKEKYSNWYALVQGTISKEPICTNQTIQSIGGNTYTYFSKSTQWGEGLWTDCVSQVLATDLYVESWIRGSSIGPACTKAYHVTDVKEVHFVNIPNFTWSSFDDHSKWATSPDGMWTCFGDINRMTTQFERGGGAICFVSIGYSLANAVAEHTSCS